MTLLNDNRFEDFFADEVYILLKNHLYNYCLRRRAVQKYVQSEQGELILEVGSGLSPMTEASDRIVYSDLSFPALRTLKRMQGRGYFVVADAAHLPFKAGSFLQVICSEVLEHLPEDRSALRQISSVMKSGGSLILTFPHRRAYFAGDDRFVNHFRRYELEEMITNLAEAGLKTLEIQKVLGPLEKITMLLVVSLFAIFGRVRKEGRTSGVGERRHHPVFWVTLFHWLNRLYSVPVWLDTRLCPRCFATVLLLRTVKREDPVSPCRSCS